MLDRERIVTVLKKRFPGAGAIQIAAAANAIVGLEEEWEELTPPPRWCSTGCYLDAAMQHGAELRVFRRLSVD